MRASTPTDAAKLVVPDMAEEVRGRDLGPRPDPGRCSSSWLAREQAGLDALRSRPALADPGSLVQARTDEVGRLLRSGPGAPSATRLDRADDDIGHQRARARALSPLATLQRGYAVLQDADGHVVTSVAGVAPRRGCSACASPTAGSTSPPTGSNPSTAAGGARWPMSPRYEQAREELIEVVRRLEAGGVTLEESLALWERGEQLGHGLPGVARRCPPPARRGARPDAE